MDGTTVLWCGLSSGTPDIVSIPRLIEDNAATLRARYLAWIYELGELRSNGRRLIDHLQLRPGFSYWWMTLFVEKCNYSKSPLITDAIRLFAFTDWAAGRSVDKITLASANRQLAECLRGWCEKSSIQFEWRQLPNTTMPMSWARQVYAALPIPLQALTWLLRYLITRRHLRGAGLQAWKQTEGRITFISYLFNLVPDAAKVGRYESRYWTKLPDALKSDGSKTNWLHLYIEDELLPDAKQAAILIDRFNDAGGGAQNHTTLDSFLGMRVLLQALMDWGRLIWKGKKLNPSVSAPSKESLNLWPLFEKDWRQSMGGITALNNVLSLRLIEAALESLPRQQVGVYLQENQGWEFGLIHAWNAAGHSKLIGTPHSSVRFWDLRYFFDPRCYPRSGNNLLPLPDKIALNGQLAEDTYLQGGYPEKALVEVEALRYLYLDDSCLKPQKNILPSNKEVRLLVLGGYSASNTRLQMRLLAQAASLLPPRTTITVKSHPSCPIRTEEYPSLYMKSTTESIAKVLEECDVAYTSAVTSAAVDAYCSGVPLVSVLDPTSLNLSPLRNYTNVSFVSTPVELACALASASDRTKSVACKSTIFTIDKSLKRWKTLVQV